MVSEKRIPTMRNSLRSLLDKGVEVATVLDVGILTGTQPLIETFPDRPHHLFEPVDLHFGQIQKNYRNIDFHLHHVALSDSDGTTYLARRAIHRDGRITHSEVVETPVSRSEVPDLVDCLEIPRLRLDTVMERESPPVPYLLKIDVDGHEMNVLRGAERSLEKCSVVVIEAPLNRVELPHFFERSAFLMSHGFYLMDIVDLAYYDGILWQADLVFVSQSIVRARPELRPFEAEGFKFSGENWYPLSDRLFKGWSEKQKLLEGGS
ncbi:MAG: FkbM family methyltransferase [Pseudomonadales bacterium]